MTHVNKIEYKNFTWIDICNPDLDKLSEIAKEFNLDYYQIRDSLEIGHLPKFEKSDKYSFLILRAFSANQDRRVNHVNQLTNKVAFFYNEKKIITIHRTEFSFMKEVKVEYNQSEELLLFFIHKMIQSYVSPTNRLSQNVDTIEQTIFLKDHSRISLKDLYYQKRQTRITKKILQITQNVINHLEVSEVNRTAIQDIKDQLLHLILSYEEVAEDSNNLLNTYLSVNAQTNNDVIKLLTIFSAFFLPLTFIVGIYGMNFENMPELKWQMGYFLILGLMLGVAGFIYFWFKRKNIL